MPRDGFSGSADVTSTEAHFSRSLKMRMGVLDCLDMLARRGEQGEAVPFESTDDLAFFAANHVFISGWDVRPCSSETAKRWVKQYALPNGFFQLANTRYGSLTVNYQSEAMRKAAHRLIREHRPRKRRVTREK